MTYVPKMNRHGWLVLFSAPALVMYGVFAVYPILGSLRISLQDSNGHYVGLRNYHTLFANPALASQFWHALLHSAEFFAICLAVQLPVALLMASLLASDSVGHWAKLYRVVLFLPSVLSVVIVGFMWRIILSPLWGLVSFPLLGDSRTALPTLALIASWAYVGIPMLFLYSSLIAIPADVLEAARMDGASNRALFFHIKLPLIAPQFGLISVLTFVWTFNIFDLIFALNGSTPGPDYSTDVLATFFYRTFFGSHDIFGDENLGSAVAVVSFCITAALTAVYFLTVQRRLRYANE